MMNEQVALSPDRAEMTTRILDSAERLFRHYGYTKTTVADVAKDLGMSPANIYRFFASKAEIHEALADRMLAQKEVFVRSMMAQPISASDRVRLFVIANHRNVVETMLDQQKVHEMVVIAIEHQWPVIEAHLDRMAEILSDVIKDGIASGEFADQDTVLAANCLMASVISVCHPQVVAQCMARKSHPSPENLAEFALRALRAQPNQN